MTRVMIHPATYDTVQPAVEKAFALFPVAIKGKKVLIKPNLLRGSEAEEGVVTNPACYGPWWKKWKAWGRPPSWLETIRVFSVMAPTKPALSKPA